MLPPVNVVNKTSSYLELLVLPLVHLDNMLNNTVPMEIVPTYVLIVTILVLPALVLIMTNVLLVKLQDSISTMFVMKLAQMDTMVMKPKESVLNVTLLVPSVSDIQMVTVPNVNKVGSLMDILVLKFVQLVNMPINLLDIVNLVNLLVSPVPVLLLNTVLLVPLQNSGIITPVETHVQMDILELKLTEEFVLHVILPV
jgi:hypothetical protein